MQKNFLMVGFLVHAALLTSLPFIIWGVLTVAGNITNEVCVGLDIALAGGETDLPSTIPCPDVDESKESLDSVFDSINNATRTINSNLLGTLSKSHLVSYLQFTGLRRAIFQLAKQHGFGPTSKAFWDLAGPHTAESRLYAEGIPSNEVDAILCTSRVFARTERPISAP